VFKHYARARRTIILLSPRSFLKVMAYVTVLQDHHLSKVGSDSTGVQLAYSSVCPLAGTTCTPRSVQHHCVQQPMHAAQDEKGIA
jgi:hypothetical protein